MLRSPVSGIGFGLRSARFAPARLSNALAASLAVASLSVCLLVTVTALSIKVVAAMPISG